MIQLDEDKRLKVFVASSLEAKQEDQFIRGILENNNINAITWKDIFHTGEFGLESLLNITEQVHGAVIISTCDDKIWYRGKEGMAPRDNILFEMGLFVKSLGLKHVALVFCKNEKGEKPQIPTDINGLNVIFFEKDKKAISETRLEKWIHNFKQVLIRKYEEKVKFVVEQKKVDIGVSKKASFSIVEITHKGKTFKAIIANTFPRQDLPNAYDKMRNYGKLCWEELKKTASHENEIGLIGFIDEEFAREKLGFTGDSEDLVVFG